MNTTLDSAPAKGSGETPQAAAAIERIKAILASAPAVLFMKGTPDFPQCGFSAQVVATLADCRAVYAHWNVLADPELREALKRYSQWPTYPQLYVRGELIGGFDIVKERHQQADLQELLQEAGAIERH
jgi:monothiol glutaredoxin